MAYATEKEYVATPLWIKTTIVIVFGLIAIGVGMSIY